MTPDHAYTTTMAILRNYRERVEAMSEAPWAWSSVGEKSNEFMLGLACDTKGQRLYGRVDDADDLVDPVLVGESATSSANFADAVGIVLLRNLALDQVDVLIAGWERHRSYLNAGIYCEYCSDERLSPWPCPDAQRIAEFAEKVKREMEKA